jgi:CheY-like chemotaxis protein
MPDKMKDILIVDDNRIMADVVRFNLERSGYTVTVAENGRVAADLVQIKQFDFIITDYQMPEMNGEVFCRFLRQNARHANVPVLMCSAKGLELDTNRLKDELGISEILFKPFSLRQIVEIVRTALEKDAVMK